ncbi:TetR/AcrR family transcriptional regulator [Nocardia takedensis]|uniref:TetR/AcrR family transcriptional regulator n=1 Tax=Nocardia takedensis TaxID=259390 RepID=UPI0005934963|nr:TetR/AcrR family transcriptional regulator [Nocardia takedensis]
MSRPAARASRGDRRAPSRGDQQRAAIIAAVTDLLGAVPIKDLSVARIADHARVSRPAFYFYFESKYAVVAAALAQVWAEVDTATAELGDYGDGEAPEVFTGRMLDAAVTVWSRHAPLLNACVQARDSDPQLRDLWDEFIGAFVRKLVGFVRDQVAAGRAAPAVTDIPALITALFSMTIGVLRQESVPAGEVSTDRALAAAREIWLSAVWGRRS